MIKCYPCVIDALDLLGISISREKTPHTMSFLIVGLGNERAEEGKERAWQPKRDERV